MENRNVVLNNEASDQTLKLTALLYLEEALLKQEFESCPELIDSAKKLGAQQSEITEVITAYLQADQTEKPKKSRAKNTAKNRLT